MVGPQHICEGRLDQTIFGKVSNVFLGHFLLFQSTWLHAYLGFPMKEAFVWCLWAWTTNNVG